MAIRTPDLDVGDSDLSGHAELMAYLRKYSAQWWPAIERWLTNDASAERVALCRSHRRQQGGKAPSLT
jgi:hypothetical protein